MYGYLMFMLTLFWHKCKYENWVILKLRGTE